MKKEWKPLIYHGKDFGDMYEVSSNGEIRNVKTGKLRKVHKNHQGYLYCVVSRGRKHRYAIKVHRAVAENFIVGDKSLTIDHIDGDKLNNNADNLEFVTQLENNRRARRNGLVGDEKLSTDDRKKIKKDYDSGTRIADIARTYNVGWTTIYRFVSGQSYRTE